MYQHIAKNEQFVDIENLMKLPDIGAMTVFEDKREYSLCTAEVTMVLIASGAGYMK